MGWAWLIETEAGNFMRLLVSIPDGRPLLRRSLQIWYLSGSRRRPFGCPRLPWRPVARQVPTSHPISGVGSWGLAAALGRAPMYLWPTGN